VIIGIDAVGVGVARASRAGAAAAVVAPTTLDARCDTHVPRRVADVSVDARAGLAGEVGVIEAACDDRRDDERNGERDAACPHRVDPLVCT
jgi:hypothetical protein